MKATQQYFLAVLSITLYKVVLTFGSVNKVLLGVWPFKWQSCWVVFSCGAVYYAVQGCSSFWVCGWNPKLWPFKWKILGLSCGTVYYALQGCSSFWVCEWNPYVWPFKWKLLSSTFLWYCLLCSTSQGGFNV